MTTRLIYDKAKRTIMREVPCSRCGQMTKKPEGANLRFMRTQAGLSLHELARRLKFSVPYLSDIELNRRNCTPEILTAYEALR